MSFAEFSTQSLPHTHTFCLPSDLQRDGEVVALHVIQKVNVVVDVSGGKVARLVWPQFYHMHLNKKNNAAAKIMNIPNLSLTQTHTHIP